MEIDRPQGSKPKMTSTVNLSSTIVLPTEVGIKLSAVLDSVELENHHSADNKDTGVTHVAPQDELTSAKQSYLSLNSGEPSLCNESNLSTILISDVVNSRENLHLHECCDIATTVPVCKRLMEYDKGLSEYSDRNLMKKLKDNSYPGYGALGPLLPLASNPNLQQSASTVPLTRVDTELSHVEAPLDQQTSPLLVTDKATSQIFHLDENSTIAMKIMHASKRPLEKSGISEYTDGILKKRQKHCCTEHEAVIPDHMQVTNTEFVSSSAQIFGSGAFSGLFQHKAFDNDVERSVQEDRATSNQMDENQRIAFHSAENRIIEDMVENNKENDSAPSVSQSAELIQEMLDSSGLQYDVTSLPNNTYSKVSMSKVQFTVKLAGYSLSSQENLSNTTVQQLMESSCRKIGIDTPDMYGVLCGKSLFFKDLLSCYPIYRDSTVDFRLRFRGGRIQTYVDKFSVRDDVLFDYVVLPQDLINTSTGDPLVSKLARYSRYNLKQLLVCLTGHHRAGKSFNGMFDKRDITYHSGRAFIRNRSPMVNFTGQTCGRDYEGIRNIIKETFIAPDGGYPQYFTHLLDYLARCPAGDLSSSETAIRFLVNHPVLEFFMDRCKQCMLLDNILHRVFGIDRTIILRALGGLPQWARILLNCPTMHDRFYSDFVNGRLVKNPAFTFDPKGYIHYSNIFFKHAPNAFKLEELEAAHSVNSGRNLAQILERISVKLLDAQYEEFRKQNSDFFDLLGNDLADKFYGEN